VNARHREFPLFDSLRAIAFTSVLLTHAAIFAGLETTGTHLGPFYARMDVGVDIFFAISAFLLYRPFAVAHIEAAAPPRVRAFAWRRVLRIVPPYWLILTVVSLWIGGSAIFRPAHIPFYYGFAQVYNVHTLTLQGLPQAWSLCVEASFYVFLPLYAAGLRRLPGRTRSARVRVGLAGAGALVVIGIAYNAVIGAPGAVSQMPWHFALPAFIDYFAIGIALATLSAGHEDGTPLPAPLRALERFPALAWLFALVAFALVSKWVGLPVGLGTRYTYAANMWRHLLYGAVALGVVLPAVFGDPRRGVVRRILSNRVLLYVGTVSYAAYLLEFAVLTQLQRWGFDSVARSTSAYAWFVVPLLATVALASVSWFAYERPILRLKRLVSPVAPERETEVVLEPARAEVGVG
jgi:peptidoglycan/LPS O-acetylase OafA/YrhL